MSAARLNSGISGANMWLVCATALLLGLPLAASLWLRYLAGRCARDRQRAQWVGYARWTSILMIFEVPSWWCLCVVIRNWRNHDFITAVPFWILLMIPPSASMLIARIFSYQSDAHIFGKRWTIWDLFQLALWRTASSTFALLTMAVGIEKLSTGRLAGFGWLLGAGTIAVVARLRLRTAEGLIPRPVKSGELYKRALVLSKRMNVPLKRVCVVPFGRGHLTNAYGGRTQIAITDDYGHWLHGSQLDFVVGHELAHAKRNDALKTLATMAGIYAALAAATLLMSYLPANGQFVLAFVAILFPLLMFYALSRHHEYVADRLSVEATGEPEMAIRALAGLYRHADAPTERSRFAELFSTHPGLWHRINAIARLGGVSPEFVASIQGSFTDAVVPDPAASEIDLTVPPRTS